MKIKITRSPRRKSTVGARIVGDAMLVNAPADMAERKLAEIAENFQRRFERQKHLTAAFAPNAT